MKPRGTVGLIAGALLTSAVAAAPAPDDFAFGIPLGTDGEGAFWQMELPAHVYRTVTRADLGDVRVFNAAGKSVAHAVTRPVPQTGEIPPAVVLPFFALHGGSEGAARAWSVVADERGNIVEVTNEQRGAADTAAPLAAYLIDASGADHPLTQLDLAWERTDTARDFVVTVRVESSDDLVRWQTWVGSTALADMRAGERTLSHRQIILPPGGARYLRLSWPPELAGVQLTRVTATQAATRVPRPLRWESVAGERSASPVAGAVAFEFDAGAYWPVERVRLAFADTNAVVRATLSSRPDSDAPWRMHQRGEFYQLRKDGVLLRSEPTTLAPTAHRHWRLEIEGHEHAASAGAPTLELGWAPHILTFVAQGQGPYMLTYGSATVAPAELLGDTMRRVTAMVPLAPPQIGVPQTLGGESRLRAPPPGLPWKQWLLWAVLVMGVATLAWMVRNVSRGLSRP